MDEYHIGHVQFNDDEMSYIYLAIFFYASAKILHRHGIFLLLRHHRLRSTIQRIYEDKWKMKRDSEII